MTIQVKKGARVSRPRPLFGPGEFVQHAGQVGQINARWRLTSGWCYSVEDPNGAHSLLPESQLRAAPLCCWCDEPATTRACGDLACDHHARVYSDEQHLAQFAATFAE